MSKFGVRTSGPTLALLAFLVGWILSQPFGNFPLNDDWQYAAVAKRLFETGRIVIDTPIAPSLVGQVLMVQPALWITGWNHITLRSVTLILSLGILFFFRSLLKKSGSTAHESTFLILLLAFNPLFFYSSQTFMTEIYAYFIAFLATFLWFRFRLASRDFRLISAPIWILSAVLFAASFWIRQFAVVLFPALLGAWYFAQVLESPRSATLVARKNFLNILTSILTFVVGVWLYFVWSRFSGNSKPAFTGPLANITGFSARAWVSHIPVTLLYWSFLWMPAGFFFASRWAFCETGSRRLRKWIMAGLGVGIVLAIYSAYRPEGLLWTRWVKPRFPYLGNLIFDAGLGPLTTTDTFHYSLPDRPKWPSIVFAVVGVISTSLIPVWIVFLHKAPAVYRALRNSFEKELFLFGFLLFFGTEFVVIQSYRMEVFDRYHLLPLMGLIFPLAAFLNAEGFQRAKGDRAPRLWALPLAGLIIYSVFGMHDYHDWNRIRWQWVDYARAQGISPFNIEGGFEVNGWHLHDDSLPNKQMDPKACIGPCETDGVWHALETSYRITLNPMDGYEIWKEERPSYWLASGPTVKLLRRVSAD